MKRNKTILTLTGLALAASVALTGCGASAPAQGVQAAGVQQSASAADITKFPAGDVINDGKGDYQLAGVADDDPINTVDLKAVDAATTDTFSKDEIQQAQRLVGQYLSEAIDSPMRIPAYRSGPVTDSMKKVERDYEKRLLDKFFIPGYRVDDPTTPKDPSKTTDPYEGTRPFQHDGMDLTDVSVVDHDPAAGSAAFSYDYGKDKQRITYRTMTVKEVLADTIATQSTLGDNSYQAPKVDLGPSLNFRVDVAYGVHALLDGQPIIETQTTEAHVSLVRHKGKMVISDASFKDGKKS